MPNEPFIYSSKVMDIIGRERYINPYTDFGFKKLFEQAEIARYDEDERRQYFESQKEYWDYTSTLETAARKGEAKGRAEGFTEGEAKGRAEGEAKGRAEALFDNARKMKSKGFSVKDIAEITGLSSEDIASL